MATDDLFPVTEPETPAASASTESPKPEAKATVTSAPASDTNTQVVDALTALTARLEAMEGKLAQPQAPAPAPARATDSDEFFQEFLADGPGVMEKAGRKAAEGVLQEIAPALRTMADHGQTAAVNAAKSTFEGKWGAGAWDKLVGEKMTTALGTLREQGQVADSNQINGLVQGILGSVVDSEEGQAKIREVQAAKRESSRREAPVMLTGNRPAPPRDNLTPDEKSMVVELKKAVPGFDEARYLKARNTGNSEEAWGATWMNEDDLPTAGKPNGAAQKAS